MNDRHLNTLGQLQAFLDGTMAVGFAVAADVRYDFIARTLQRFGYRRLPRTGKGVVAFIFFRNRGNCIDVLRVLRATNEINSGIVA